MVPDALCQLLYLQYDLLISFLGCPIEQAVVDDRPGITKTMP
jgi:hypothetical protein